MIRHSVAGYLASNRRPRPVRLLLDTSYLYKLMAAPDHLSDAERMILTNHAVPVYVSAVSVWEMRLKFKARNRSGGRASPFDPNDVVAALDQQNVIFVPMTVSHAAQDLEVPIAHKDPFDELLLVQAQEEGLKLLTVDRQLVTHPLAITP